MPKGAPYIQPSQRENWETPPDLFDALWTEYGGFDFDPFCTPDQYTARRVLANGGTICVPPDFPNVAGCERAQNAQGHIWLDGLAQPWHGKVWMNSPYGLFLRKSVAKAVHEVECGNAGMVMALVPSRTDVQWWQQYVVSSIAFDRFSPENNWTAEAHSQLTEVRFLKSRLQFVGAPDPATFPSAIVIWRR